MNNSNGKKLPADQLYDDELDLDESWDEASYGLIQSRFTAEELLERLITSPEPVLGRDLYVFSDLSRQDLELVRQGWSAIPVDRRRTVITNLVDLAESDLDWHLGRVFRIALQDSDPTVRRLAIEGLGEDTESDLLGPLIDLLRNDDHVEVRAAAAAALGNFVRAGELDERDSALAMRAEQVLLETLREPDEPITVQSRALESIAYSGEAGMRQLIEDAYYSPHEMVRVSALVAMGRSADVHWRTYARAELQSPSPAMRAEAARTCGELEARSALNDLLELLVDDSQPVRLAAIFALGRVGGKAAREALRAISSEGEPIEAEAADEALDELLLAAENESITLYDEEETDDDDEHDYWRNDDDELGEYER